MKALGLVSVGELTSTRALPRRRRDFLVPGCINSKDEIGADIISLDRNKTRRNWFGLEISTVLSDSSAIWCFELHPDIYNPGITVTGMNVRLILTHVYFVVGSFIRILFVFWGKGLNLPLSLLLLLSQD